MAEQRLDLNALRCEKDHDKYQPMIEEKGTAEESIDLPDEEGIECKIRKEKPVVEPRIGTGKRRALLLIGVGAVVLISILLAVVSTMVGRSFSKPNANEAFDFSDVGPDFGYLEEETVPSVIQEPTFRPTVVPTSAPSKKATRIPTSSPTIVTPTLSPTPGPSPEPKPPSPAPIEVPTASPTPQPITLAPITPWDPASDTLMTFCVIADVPYDANEVKALPNQISSQMEGCEFLVHLGDIMTGEVECTNDRYTEVRDILLDSPIPAFIVVGDNEWNDCGNNNQINAAWGRWEENFMQIENNWNHTFNVSRQDEYPENFYFVHKRTLVFGLNIVGGKVHDTVEWATRLTKSHEFVQSIGLQNVPVNADGIIIMAHGRPTTDHRHFFNPIRSMIEDVFNNEVPVLYLHGDGHSWIYTPNWYEQPNYLRIQHQGGTRDPILKIYADPQKLGPSVTSAFQYDRQL